MKYYVENGNRRKVVKRDSWQLEVNIFLRIKRIVVLNIYILDMYEYV